MLTPQPVENTDFHRFGVVSFARAGALRFRYLFPTLGEAIQKAVEISESEKNHAFFVIETVATVGNRDHYFIDDNNFMRRFKDDGKRYTPQMESKAERRLGDEVTERQLRRMLENEIKEAGGLFPFAVKHHLLAQDVKKIVLGQQGFSKRLLASLGVTHLYRLVEASDEAISD